MATKILKPFPPQPAFTGNEFTVELYEEDYHYPYLREWWESRQLPVTIPELLPTTGVVGFVDGVPCVALLAYEDVVRPVAHLDWMVSRPGMSLAEVRPLLNLAYQELEAWLRENGTLAIIANAEPAIARYFEDAGFLENKQTVTSVKILQ